MFHRKRIMAGLIIGLLFVAACASGAWGQAVVTDSAVVDQTYTNECNEDVVTLNGTLHSEISFSTNPNGMTHMSLNATSHLTGAGFPSGANYVASDSTHMETNTRGFAQEQTNNTKLKLISQGPQPNMMNHATLHVIIDKNGVPKVEISKHQIKCN